MDMYYLVAFLSIAIFLVLFAFFLRGNSHMRVDELFARENARTRTELLAMLEQYRSSVGEMESRVSHGLEAMRIENERRIGDFQQSIEDRLKSSLASSFQVVSEQLGKVHEGLGEVKELSGGVEDLKRIMANVKSRGTIGEVQAKSILDDILAPGQYECNVECKPHSGMYVEFALRLPGLDDGVVYLPIDCKFPREDYERLQEANENGDAMKAQTARKALGKRIKEEAKSIAAKYLDPPHTTAFALMFLPSESLYAEVIRLPGLVDEIQRLYKVVVSGPTTLAAILNSLQMGFCTLTIQKQSEKVWETLSTVRTEFERLGRELETVQGQMERVSRSFQDVAKRTRILGNSLRQVDCSETLTENENA